MAGLKDKVNARDKRARNRRRFRERRQVEQRRARSLRRVRARANSPMPVLPPVGGRGKDEPVGRERPLGQDGHGPVVAAIVARCPGLGGYDLTLVTRTGDMTLERLYCIA